MKRTGRSKEAVERLGYLSMKKKKKKEMRLNILTDTTIAIVDSDIYIKSTAPNIFDDLGQEYDFGGVLEREMPIESQISNKIRKYSQSAFTNLKDVDWRWNNLGAEFYNMGLMVMNKSFG